MTLALSFATTGLASASDTWSDDLEQRGYDILEAYQNVARGAFDEPEEYEAREYIADTIPERRSSEDDFEQLAARFRTAKRSIDSHGYPHDSWRQAPFGHGRRGVRLEERDSEHELEARDLFPHDTAAISSLRKRISNRRKARKAQKAAKAAAKEKEELERRAWSLIEEYERREEEEQLAARQFEVAKRVVLARRTLRKIINEARQLTEEEEALAAREHEEEFAARDAIDEAKVEAREATELVVEARAPSPHASEANVIEAREPAKEEVTSKQGDYQTREPNPAVDSEVPAKREVETAEVSAKREVQEGDLKAREPAPAPVLEEGKPLVARSEAEVGEAVAQRSESDIVLTPRSEEPVAGAAN